MAPRLSNISRKCSLLKIIFGAPGWTQSVKCPTSAQVMISWFVGLSPAVLTDQRLEPTSDSRILCLPLSLSAPALLVFSLSLSLSLSKINSKVFNPPYPYFTK